MQSTGSSMESDNIGRPSWITDQLQIDLTEDILGVGPTGNVIRIRRSDQEEYALKRTLTKDKEPRSDLARLKHPHVVNLLHYWIEEGGEGKLWPGLDAGVKEESGPSEERYMCQVMELMDGDIEQLIADAHEAGVPPFSLRVARDLMLQIAGAMLHLHDMGVSHPDLKCANALFRINNVTDGAFVVGDVIVKLGGFGCSRPADVGSKERDLQCFGWVCAEILTGEKNLFPIHEKPEFRRTTPEILKDCILSCWNKEVTFSEIMTKLADLDDEILTGGVDEQAGRNLAKMDLGYRAEGHEMAKWKGLPRLPGGLKEIFTVHQLHPQLGENSTSVRAILIFFHGFHKVPEEWRRTWMTRDNKLVWPQTWLPEDLGPGNIRVLSVSFDADANKTGNYNRFETAKSLLWSLILSPESELGEIEGKVFVVGHCFGGVIIKSLVTEASRFARKNIRKNNNLEWAMKCKTFLESLATIVFYSVPHALKGQDFENYISECKMIFGSRRSSFVQSLWEDPRFIPDMYNLSEEFESVVSDQKMKVLAFLEGEPMGKNRLLFTSESCESRSWEWHKINKDNHFEVCRPDSKNHIGYKEMKDHFQRLMNGTGIAEDCEAGKVALQPIVLTSTKQLIIEVEEKKTLELEHKCNLQELEPVPVLATSSMHQDNYRTFGRDQKIIMEEVIQKLQQDAMAHSEDDIECVGIWSMGGLGKTFVVQQVFNNNKIRAHFKGGCYWLTVGYLETSVPNLFHKLYQEMVTQSDIVKYGHENIKNDLCKALKDWEKMLLVLDDVWKIEVLELLDVMPKGVQCKVLITTRNEGVLIWTNTTKLKMPTLSQDHDWMLFYHHAWDNKAWNHGGDMPKALKRVGKKIASACGGHPLALIVIGEHLGKNIDPSYWEQVLDEVKNGNVMSSDQYIEQLYSTLESSVNELEKVQLRLKDCFFYFATFPNGYHVELRRDLFPLWWGDQIVGAHLKNDPMKEAENLLDLLVQRSLIEVIPPRETPSQFNKRDKVYVVHNVLRGLIHRMLQNVSIEKRDRLYVASLDRNSLPEEYYRTSNLSEVTHLSLMASKVMELDSKLLNAPKLQVMMLRDNPKIIPIGFCSDHLRVLDLSGTHIRSLPEKLNLKHLVVLNLHGSSVKNLSSNFFKTSTNLEVLDVGECHKLEGLPSSISLLNKLQYFHAMPFSKGDLWRVQILMKTRLASVKDLMKLVSLKELRLQSESDQTTLPDDFFRKLKHLRVLNLAFRSLGAVPEPSRNVLQHLQVLDLGRCSSLTSLPNSFGIVPKNLHTLNLDYCKGLQSLPEGLANLPKLEYLHLNRCEGLVSLPDSFSKPGAFPVLKKLEVTWPNTQARFPELQPGAMPQLEELNLFGWHQLVDFPKAIANLTKLRILSLANCSNLRSLEHDGVGIRSLANLEKLDVACSMAISALPDGLEDLPELREICAWVTAIKYSLDVAHLVIS